MGHRLAVRCAPCAWVGIAGAVACGPDATLAIDGGGGSTSTGTEATSTDDPGAGRTATSAQSPSSDGSSTPDDVTTTAATEASSTSDDATTMIVTTEPSSTSEATDSTTGAAQPCGNGVLEEGEECDDGNSIDSDACTAACMLAVCGDGLVWLGQEECDDANAEDADGCTNDCVERFPVVYMTIVEENFDMWRYSAEFDTWETLTGPSNYFGSLTWDGSFLYTAVWGGAIHRYDPSLDTWSVELPGPQFQGVEDSFPVLIWTADGLYLAQERWWGEQCPIYVHRNGQWTEFFVDHHISAAGSWDPATHELYIREPNELSFFVIDTTTDTVVRTVTDETQVYESSRTGTYLDGGFYGLPADGELTRLDASTGAQSASGVTPTSMITATSADPYKRHLYIAGQGTFANHFERYDANDGTLTTLAPVPTDPYPDYWGTTNILVVYP